MFKDFFNAKNIAKEMFDINLEDISKWTKLEESEVQFSRFHFNGNKSFELPFYPKEYVYSSIKEVEIDNIPKTKGYYKRGINKYYNLLKNNKKVPPVIFIFRNGNWHLSDGNHRYSAHVMFGKNKIDAIFAFPLNIVYDKSHEDEDYSNWLNISKREDTVDEFLIFLQHVMGWTYQYSYNYAKINYIKS